MNALINEEGCMSCLTTRRYDIMFVYMYVRVNALHIHTYVCLYVCAYVYVLDVCGVCMHLL